MARRAKAGEMMLVGGERRIEAVSCEELAQSAAVILALLIDPHAAPPEAVVVEADPVPEAEPPAESEPEEEPATRTAAYAGLGSVRGFVRIEVVADVGLFPSVAVGPGLAASRRGPRPPPAGSRRGS